MDVTPNEWLARYAPSTGVFDALREQVALTQIVETDAHHKAQCVAHSDASPSLHVYDDHVHCFGCGFHGDVVDVWGAVKRIDRPIEAALDLAQVFGIKLPEMTPETRQQTAERRAHEQSWLTIAQSCHEALDSSPRVREWWEGRGFDAALRERFALGAGDGDEATIPYWHRGRVHGLIRRQLQGEPKYILPPGEEIVGGRKPLFIPGPARGDTFLVEGPIDAMAVVATGRNAIAVGGTQMSQEQAQELSEISKNIPTLYILPDADESGAAAARAWGRTFFPYAKICQASYGGTPGAKDIADTFAQQMTEETADHLDRLVAGAHDLIDIEANAAAELEGGPREKLAYATKHIVPLLARLAPPGLQDVTADIVVDRVKGLKKNWINKAIKDENESQLAEMLSTIEKEVQKRNEQRTQEYAELVKEAQPEIDALFSEGVLERLRNTAASMHHVYGDEEALDLALMVALGPQLAPLPNGRPLGASILLTARAGRGKNHIVDAAVQPLPEEFYFAFEIASGQSLYYKADEDPDFLKHTFAYPNEIEGAEALWEFLRPMLSKGKATKIVTAKDADGNMTTRTIVVEGPVTIAIPTIRNKTDEQLQTRLLVAELPDYPGRVKQHSRAVSEQLLPDAAVGDHSHELFLWKEGLRQLTVIRRVVFPMRHPDFALDNDELSHGARTWANLLSVMATHAWLEQKNRRTIELPSGEIAVIACPEDYARAYAIFNKVCRRSVVNLSDTHRKILDALYALHNDNPERDGFRTREVSTLANVSTSTVSEHRTFLVTSAKLMKESEAGLALVDGADPSWWSTGGVMKGLPTPEMVKSWWDDDGGGR